MFYIILGGIGLIVPIFALIFGFGVMGGVAENHRGEEVPEIKQSTASPSSIAGEANKYTDINPTGDLSREEVITLANIAHNLIEEELELILAIIYIETDGKFDPKLTQGNRKGLMQLDVGSTGSTSQKYAGLFADLVNKYGDQYRTQQKEFGVLAQEGTEIGGHGEGERERGTPTEGDKENLFEKIDPLNPAVSVYFGSRYLKELRDWATQNFTGQPLTAAIAAYHFGKGIVQDAHGLPNQPEVQNYSRKVMEKYQQYKKLTEILSNGDLPTSDQIFLHWSAGGYDVDVYKSVGECNAARDKSPNKSYPAQCGYSAIVDGSGKVIPGFGLAHTVGRNSSGVGYAVAAMAGGTESCYRDIRGSSCPTPVTEKQLTAFINLIAETAKKNSIPVDVKYIMSHAEAASLRDFTAAGFEKEVKLVNTNCNRDKYSSDSAADGCAQQYKPGGHAIPHYNYGPSPWGGSGAIRRWDFYTQENAIREKVAKRLAEVGGNPNPK